MAAVEEQYRALGGASPLNEANRRLVTKLKERVPADWLGERVYLANRNTEPFIGDVVAQMNEAGISRAAVFVTSAFSSYSGCRMYRENLADGISAAGVGPDFTVLPRFHDRPELTDIWADQIREVWPEPGAHLIFATHSLPVSGSQKYVEQHFGLARRIVAALGADAGEPTWELAYQSRSGSPKIPWLEPDVADVIAGRESGSSVVVAPIGFAAPNLEISWDLDRLAAQSAADAGIEYHRAEPPQDDPRFVDLVMGQLQAQNPVRCAVDCCPNPRGARPAVGDARV